MSYPQGLYSPNQASPAVVTTMSKQPHRRPTDNSVWVAFFKTLRQLEHFQRLEQLEHLEHPPPHLQHSQHLKFLNSHILNTI